MFNHIKRKKRYSEMDSSELIKRALDAVPYIESYEHRNIVSEMSHRLGRSTVTLEVIDDQVMKSRRDWVEFTNTKYYEKKCPSCNFSFRGGVVRKFCLMCDKYFDNSPSKIPDNHLHNIGDYIVHSLPKSTNVSGVEVFGIMREVLHRYNTSVGYIRKGKLGLSFVTLSGAQRPLTPSQKFMWIVFRKAPNDLCVLNK